MGAAQSKLSSRPSFWRTHYLLCGGCTLAFARAWQPIKEKFANISMSSLGTKTCATRVDSRAQFLTVARFQSFRPSVGVENCETGVTARRGCEVSLETPGSLLRARTGDCAK